jgi:hypothetical protein
LYLVGLALELSRNLGCLHGLVLDLGHGDGKRQRKQVLIVETAPLEDRLGSDYALDRPVMDRGAVETFTIHEIMLESGPEADDEHTFLLVVGQVAELYPRPPIGSIARLWVYVSTRIHVKRWTLPTVLSYISAFSSTPGLAKLPGAVDRFGHCILRSLNSVAFTRWIQEARRGLIL